MKLVSCLNPQWITNPYTKEKLVVPCGKCEKCLHTRQGQWVNRLMLEKEQWKYCIFFTLTFSNEFLPKLDISSLTDLSDLDFKRISDPKSAPLIRFNNGMMPYFPVTYLQKFIKRLRKWLNYYELPQNQILRYYIATEFGPTTFRPHCHGILFFNSDRFADTIKERISSAWSTNNRNPDKRKSFGRIDAQFVTGDSIKYVAQYSSFVSCLPPVLQIKSLRPYSVHSSCPPIGSNWFTSEKVQKIFTNGLTEYSIRDTRTGELISLPLSRTFKNQYYPKIKGFGQLNFVERVALYSLGYDFQGLNFEQAKDFVYNRALVTPMPFNIVLLERLFGSFPGFQSEISDLKKSDPNFVLFSDNENSFKQFYYQVKRSVLVSQRFNLNLHEYVCKLEDFYSSLDLRNLKNQLMYENEYLTIPSNDLRYLPYLIDPMFAYNSRGLPDFTYNEYLNQFSLDSLNCSCFEDVRNSPEYKSCLQSMMRIYDESHKNKARNEYLDLHPEFKSLHYL